MMVAAIVARSLCVMDEIINARLNERTAAKKF